MSDDDRSWMDKRRLPGRASITEEFKRGVKQFIEFAKDNPRYMNGEKIKCPCVRCKNRKFEKDRIVEKHLLHSGFVDGYKRWISHGEQITGQRNVVRNTPVMDPILVVEPEPMIVEEELSTQRMEDKLKVAVRPEFGCLENPKEEPIVGVKKFNGFMESAKLPLFPGSKVTVLEMLVELLNIKPSCNISQIAYSYIVSTIKRMLSKNKMNGSLYENYHETKKMVGPVEFSYEKIDACENDCMLFYKEDESKMECSVCGLSRYKPNQMDGAKQTKNMPRKQLHYLPLIPRLQRLYMSKSSAKAMRWHKEAACVEGLLFHPSDGEAWKHFDATYPEFANEVRNVRLGICFGGFNLPGRGTKSYSCSSVIVTTYNLPPWLCMSDPYMFLTLLIVGRNSPGKNIDVYLRPLIDELKQLWADGTQTWDAFKKQNFNMRAAVMWVVSDFPAYEMMSGWSTRGKLACPYCMEKTKAFILSHSKKPCWFDCHRQFLPTDHPFRKQKNAFIKNREEHDQAPPCPSGDDIFEAVLTLPAIRWGKKFAKDRIQGYGSQHRWTKKSIFWELPYWKANLIRHNLDVMDIEKHVFENIFNTVMDFKGTTKDLAKGRMDLKEMCRRPSLELQQIDGKILKPVAGYVLTEESKQCVLNWLKKLRLPDGLASHISNCVDLEEGTIEGLKRHDCHVLLDRLLPIALRDLLPENIWVALTELSEFFRALTSSTLRVEDVKKLENSIVVTLCELEKIFPPSVFDLMEHLPIHLAYEARVGGPVQYRWMYPVKRFLGGLKAKMSNKAKVEASILEAIVVNEIVSFVAIYFCSDVGTRLTKARRNLGYGDLKFERCLSVFTHTGRFLGSPVSKRMLSFREIEAAKLYVLLNCFEVADYLDMFEDICREDLTPDQLEKKIDKEFPSWLKKYISDHPEDAKVAKLKVLLEDPYMEVNLYNGYVVGGYEFHTKDYGETRSTWNSGVNLNGSLTYYGVLKEVIEMRYLGGNSVVLFNCDWRHATQGIKKHDAFDIVDVNVSSMHMEDDVFVLASLAQLVYMTPYPCRPADRKEWWAVWKTQARSVNDEVCELIATTTELSLERCYQEDEMPQPANVSSDKHLLEDDAAMVQNVGQFEEVLPAELPPAPPHQGQLALVEMGYRSEDDVLEDEEDDSEQGPEDEDQDELEFY